MSSKLIMLAIWFIVIFLIIGVSKTDTTVRRRRYLVYPKPASKVQLILGTGVPIPLENHAITMGWVLKAKYSLPTNASEYTDSYVTFQKRSVQQKASRYDFYRAFESIAESFGGGGKECLLRAICEVSKIPLKATSLTGQILRIFLLPSSTDEPLSMRSDMDYHAAEILGKEESVDCKNLYSSCSFALTDLLTMVV